MWSDLNTKHLLALRAVADEGTFGRAAERLGYTQSAVSQQIAALEAIVGHVLFDRPSGPSRPQLTPAGELMLIHASSLLGGVEEAERELDRFARGISGRLVVSTFQSISTRVIPASLRRLYEEAPGVEVSLVEEDIGQDFGRAALLRGDLDLGFAIGDVSSDFGSIYLGADPHVAVVDLDYPPGPVSIESLSGAPVVGQPAEDTCGLIIDRQLERLGVTPHYAFRSHDNGAVQGMVGAGMGVAIMPLLSVDIHDRTTSIRTTDPQLEPRQLSIVWGQDRTLSPLAQRFAAIVGEVCADLLAQLQEPGLGV
jgi:DNA-binding transcriptional LysR family regulator